MLIAKRELLKHRGRRGKLSNYLILMSLLKDLQLPVLSLQRLLRSLLLIYHPKHDLNPRYALSLYPNHIRKPLSLSLLYLNHILCHLLHLLYLLRLLYYHRLLSSPQASSRQINRG